MRWYFPSWNGDVRIESSGETATKIVVISPTNAELARLQQIHVIAKKKKWTTEASFWPEGASDRHETELAAPMSKVAPLLIDMLKRGKQTLSAVVMKDDTVEIVSGTDPAQVEALAELADPPAEQGPVVRARATRPKAAVSVKRPTPCCPQCTDGAVTAASEVLLEFLTPEQHEDWAKHRAFVVRGGDTGFRYLLSHRHGPSAQKIGRMAYDLDNRAVVHFHDWSVPPEEEVLAAKLVLEHREPWLRNEATILVATKSRDMMIFKNPFGGIRDGVEDAMMTSALGGALMTVLNPDRFTGMMSRVLERMA